MEPIGLKSYMLIRVGLNVREGEWFDIRLDSPFALKASVNSGSETAQELSKKAGSETAQKLSNKIGSDAAQELSKKAERDVLQESCLERNTSLDKAGSLWRRILGIPMQTVKHSTGKPSIWKSATGKKAIGEQTAGRENEFYWKGKPPGDKKKLRRLRQDSARNKGAEEQERLQRERADRIRRVEADMKVLAAEILELAGEESRCYAVYDNSVRRAVLKKSEDGSLPSLWRRQMDFEEFTGYTEAFWTGLLMPQAVLSHFVILGTAPCVPEWIEKCASRMKSLKWILPEEKCGPEILEFVEDFYTEYGLAISLQTLPGSGNLKALGVLCSLPSNILDFTGDSCVNIPEIARGSVWLDFLSVEEKKHRIEGRCPGVSYFSLKEKWRHAQRRCKEPLLP